MTMLITPAAASVPVVGSDRRFPVRRIYCVGRNYLDHIREMKEGDERDEPFFFQKPANSIVSPGLTETWETPDLLVEEGFEYVCDWVLDDQPTRLRTRGEPIVNVPYTQECNDVAMMLIQHHTADEYRRRVIDQFDQILADARADDSARVMALVVHPYIMGAPHRLKYLDPRPRAHLRPRRGDLLHGRANPRLVHHPAIRP